MRTISSRRAWLVWAGAFGANCASAGTRWPFAADTYIAQSSSAAPKMRYVASAVLRQDADDGRIKLVHSSLLAVSKDEAIGLLTRAALQKYPGYTLDLTIAGVLWIPPAACSKEDNLAGKHALYMVSAVFPEGVDSLKPILLLNGSSYANGADDARKRFLSVVAGRYPNPAPIGWLATDLTSVMPFACAAPSPARSKWLNA